MNSEKRMGRECGNAMIYILLALALLAGLTVVLSKGSDTGGDDITKDRADLMATDLMGYAASAKNVIDQMLMAGTPLASLDFIIPSAPGFNTNPSIYKVYHPAGGGLIYEIPKVPPFVKTGVATAEGWYFVSRNVQWSASTTNEVIFSAFNVSLNVCQEINKRITGTAAPVALANNNALTLFTTSGASFLTADCPNCQGLPSLCITNSNGTYPTFYSILTNE